MLYNPSRGGACSYRALTSSTSFELLCPHPRGRLFVRLYCAWP